MRLMSAAQMKTLKTKGARGGYYQDRPREGTKIRALYDRFMNSKGVPIEVQMTHSEGPRIAYMVDQYGLDIRRITSGLWVLAGEWFGDEYVDYIAKVIKEE